LSAELPSKSDVELQVLSEYTPHNYNENIYNFHGVNITSVFHEDLAAKICLDQC
jgi:hypothetical protein